MDWQQVTSMAVVGITAILLVRFEIRKRQRAKLRACGNDCGCSGSIERIIKRGVEKEYDLK